ncbi:WD40 repeat-like protein [Martensiomyces pterosporus]|nr:WD40 repeat-like protein [Martensiomyces pterosporus]
MALPPRKQQRLSYHVGSVNAAIFDASGSYVITGGQDKMIRLCNAKTGSLVQTYKGHGWHVQGVAICQGSSRMASCGGDRSVFLWDVNEASVVRKFPGHIQRVDCVAMNANGSVVVSGSFDTTVRVWDVRSPQHTALQVLDESKDGVASVVVTESEIIAGSIDGCVRAYDIRTGKLLVDDLGQSVVSVSVSEDLRCLLASCMDGSIQLLDRADGAAIAAFSGHKCSEYRIRSDISATTVASGSEDGFVYVWDTLNNSETGGYKYRLAGHEGIVNTVAFHPGSGNDPEKCNTMVSAASDGSVIVWE